MTGGSRKAYKKNDNFYKIKLETIKNTNNKLVDFYQLDNNNTDYLYLYIKNSKIENIFSIKEHGDSAKVIEHKINHQNDSSNMNVFAILENKLNKKGFIVYKQ